MVPSMLVFPNYLVNNGMFAIFIHGIGCCSRIMEARWWLWWAKIVWPLLVTDDSAFKP